MGEKQYGGATGRTSNRVVVDKSAGKLFSNKGKKEDFDIDETFNLKKEDVLGFIEAGKIAKEVKDYAKSIIKPKTKLLDIAEKIEEKIHKLGGKPAFPVNLSINEIAAHYTPGWNDETLASGLLKIDIGVHVNGYVADTAFSMDLDNNPENKKLIETVEKALASGVKAMHEGIPVCLVGRAINDEVIKKGFSPIRNLTGHEVSRWFLHSGFTVPNYDNGNQAEIEEGAYAVEPFVTSGQGVVYESKNSGIYIFKERKAVRDALARQMMDFIEEEYKTLPFCSRWLVKKFSPRALMSLVFLKQAGVIDEYSQLHEKGQKPVAQAENTVIVFKDRVEVTTE